MGALRRVCDNHLGFARHCLLQRVDMNHSSDVPSERHKLIMPRNRVTVRELVNEHQTEPNGHTTNEWRANKKRNWSAKQIKFKLRQRLSSTSQNGHYYLALAPPVTRCTASQAIRQMSTFLIYSESSGCLLLYAFVLLFASKPKYCRASKRWKKAARGAKKKN